MKKYYVQNGKIVINKYAVKYSVSDCSNLIERSSDIVQYVTDDTEFNAIKNELNLKGILFEVVEIDVSDIERFDGLEVSGEEEARRIIEPTLEEIKTDKIKALSDICEQTIYNGIDVEMSDGSVKHFSLKIEDQININRLAFIFKDCSEEQGILYHADGEICREFSKTDFFKLVAKASNFISEQTQKCNRLMKAVEEASDISELNNIG